MKEYEDIRYQTFGQRAYVFHVVFFYHDF
jgi:hypothetical protein